MSVKAAVPPASSGSSCTPYDYNRRNQCRRSEDRRPDRGIRVEPLGDRRLPLAFEDFDLPASADRIILTALQAGQS